MHPHARNGPARPAPASPNNEQICSHHTVLDPVRHQHAPVLGGVQLAYFCEQV